MVVFATGRQGNRRVRGGITEGVEKIHVRFGENLCGKLFCVGCGLMKARAVSKLVSA
jgi:hypothetical protein